MQTQTIEVKTGFGYYIDTQGHKVAKAELPIGKHPMADGLTYVECANKEALDAIVLWVDPAVIEKAENEGKIAAKTRAIAIAKCIEDGELPPDFRDS